MMNSWMTELVKNANERLFLDSELERMMVYFGELPNRLKCCDELEKLESDLISKLDSEMKNSDFSHFPKRFVQDHVEGLRTLAHSILASDPAYFHRRWVDHSLNVLHATKLDPRPVLFLYEQIRERLMKLLSRSSQEFVRPELDEVIDRLKQESEANRSVGVHP